MKRSKRMRWGMSKKDAEKWVEHMHLWRITMLAVESIWTAPPLRTLLMLFTKDKIQRNCLLRCNLN